MRPRGVLVLRDGTTFFGESVGARGAHHGEVVFNTGMSGYEEVLTDPSYHRQIVVMTQPEIGNYGITLEDEESFGGPKVAGFVMREYNAASNHRSKLDLGEYLVRGNVPALSGVDTRRLTLHLREHGAQPGLIATEPFDLAALQAEARALQPMNGQSLAREVTTLAPYTVGQPDAPLHVVVIDFGSKRNIAQLLALRGCRVTVMPCTSTTEQVLALAPDGVLLSNGPGDPEVMHDEITLVRGLVGKTCIFGICLGHQLLGLALGAKTFKLKFGHRGGNHSVLELESRKVLITSQNHGFCVDPETLPAGASVTHINLSDGTLEGFAAPALDVAAVQFHPESSPGPLDASFLFDSFANRLRARRVVS